MRTVPVWIFLFSSCASLPDGAPRLRYKKDYDVAIQAEAFLIKQMEPGRAVDAIEPDLTGMPKHVVSFRIERILQGELPVETVGGPDKMEQARDALAEKNFFKILTLDFSNPDEKQPKEWLTVAVNDPKEIFGLDPEAPTSGMPYKLYLKHRSGERNYTLVQVRPAKV